MDTKKTLILIDGNSLMNRAYYAIQTPMISAEGIYTQGIFGFLNMLDKMLAEYRPSHMAVAFDRKTPTFRHLEYEEYKAGRRKMPAELAMQFPYLKDILHARKLSVLEIDGFEADDILGTVSLDAEENGFQTFIVTGDKDAFQLASKKTTVIYTRRGISEFDAYDEAAVYAHYGFSPAQFIDFKGLMGDSSDNLPGIPGVGEKTAKKLILVYGSVEGLLQNFDSMKKSKLKERIEEHAQLAVMSKRLATIERHVPLEYTLDALVVEEPDYDALIELYKKLGLHSFLRKLSGKMKDGKASSEAGRPEHPADAVKDVASEGAAEYRNGEPGSAAGTRPGNPDAPNHTDAGGSDAALPDANGMPEAARARTAQADSESSAPETMSGLPASLQKALKAAAEKREQAAKKAAVEKDLEKPSDPPADGDSAPDGAKHSETSGLRNGNTRQPGHPDAADGTEECLAGALTSELMAEKEAVIRQAREKIRRISLLDPEMPVTRVTDPDAMQAMCTRLAAWGKKEGGYRNGTSDSESAIKPDTGSVETTGAMESDIRPADAGEPDAERTSRFPDGAESSVDADAQMAGQDSSDIAALWLHVFHDDRHVGRPTIDSVCLAGDGGFWMIPWADWCAEPLARFFADFQGVLCGHDLQRSYYALISNGVALSGDGRDHIFETGFDTALAAYLIDPQKRSYELSVLLLEEFHKEFPSDKQIRAEVTSSDLTGGNFEKQEQHGLAILTSASSLLPPLAERLESEHLLYVYEAMELPLAEVLADMESAGIRTDANVLEEIGSELIVRIDALTAQIHDLAGEDFNINSPKQLGSILFEKLGLKNGKKTKTGYSTSADILHKIADQHPIVPLVLEYRMLTKLNGTYVDGMLPLIDEDGRIHAHFQQTVTTTGRLSCTEPNLQNIPIRQELGRQLRRVFTASSSDRTLVGADYSQVELRVMAHLSGDEALMDSFANHQDIHTATAARVFQVPLEEVTPLQRRHAKAVNFGVIYGISSFGLSEDLQVTRKQAQEYIDDYFRKHPGVRAFMDHMIEFCRQNHYVTTLSGRRRMIPEISARNYMTRQLGERLAMNTPVQGTAADIIKLAMIRVYRKIRREKLNARLILQVHDELIIDTDRSEQEKVSELLEDCMRNALSLNVPLSVEVNIADDWYQLK